VGKDDLLGEPGAKVNQRPEYGSIMNNPVGSVMATFEVGCTVGSFVGGGGRSSRRG
jgi:hypothetical protein